MEEAEAAGLFSEGHFTVDGTLIESWGCPWSMSVLPHPVRVEADIPS